MGSPLHDDAVGFSDGGSVVCWMRASSAGRDGYFSKSRWKAARCSRRMLKGSWSSWLLAVSVVSVAVVLAAGAGEGFGGSGGWFSLWLLLQGTEQL